MVLFAEAPEWVSPTGWVVAAASVLALIYKSVSQVKSLAEKQAITHYRKLVVDMTTRITKLEVRENERDDQITELRQENVECAARTAQLVSLVCLYGGALKDYEAAMTTANISFRPLAASLEKSMNDLLEEQHKVQIHD